MGLFGKLKEFIAAAAGTPADRTQPEVAPTDQVDRRGAGADADPAAERAAVQRVAREATAAFNEALAGANTSTDRATREQRLDLARVRLSELKRLAADFPYLRLTNLDQVEAGVAAIETEIRSMAQRPDPSEPDTEAPPRPSASYGGQPLSEHDERAVMLSIESHFRVINESIAIARSSRNAETRASRLRVARERLEGARKMAAQFTLKVDGFDAAETAIAEAEAALIADPPTKVVDTTEAAHADPMAARRQHGDILDGLQFSATMQLRTPLRVLERHGELHADPSKPPPKIEQELWEGIWVAKTKSFKDLGIDLPEFPPGQHASDIGPVLAAEYLPFLIAIRRIVEREEPVQVRVDALREMLAGCARQDFVQRHRGAEMIISRFFPRHIAPMPGLTAGAQAELRRLGLDTPAALADASDATLLAIKGIGPAKLQAIRAHCADMGKDRDADRADRVGR